MAYARSGAAGQTPAASVRYLCPLLISLPAVLWPLWSAAARMLSGVRLGVRAMAGGAVGGALVAVFVAAMVLPTYGRASTGTSPSVAWSRQHPALARIVSRVDVGRHATARRMPPTSFVLSSWSQLLATPLAVGDNQISRGDHVRSGQDLEQRFTSRRDLIQCRAATAQQHGRNGVAQSRAGVIDLSSGRVRRSVDLQETGAGWRDCPSCEPPASPCSVLVVLRRLRSRWQRRRSLAWKSSE
jgi:hypothetical protein